MQGANLGLRIWAIAIYVYTTGIKGTSSMKLHRDLGITQKTACEDCLAPSASHSGSLRGG